LTALARKGVARSDIGHAKWMPTRKIVFRHEINVEIDSKLMQTRMTPEQRQSFVKSCPTGVFKLNGQTVDIEDATRCTACKDCLKHIEDDVVLPHNEKSVSTVNHWRVEEFVNVMQPHKHPKHPRRGWIRMDIFPTQALSAECLFEQSFISLLDKIKQAQSSLTTLKTT
jgi:NAD-dependent dihydropyrimidine dehydrogenase PreA subunit